VSIISTPGQMPGARFTCSSQTTPSVQDWLGFNGIFSTNRLYHAI